MMRIFGSYDVLGRCTLCRRRRLMSVNLGHGVWACSACVTLIISAAVRAQCGPESITFIGGPLAGVTVGKWRGEPSPELYVIRRGGVVSLPTDRPPHGIPREDLGWYAFDDGPHGAYRWQGWLGGE